ncbi:hypothetical protein H6H03_23905 [Nostoc paludosum FACHB-159]|uniref:Uncharacterized protein n=1 Tax=Nostoc paludosum FACHB-159 TaxID=2692908 RepID=A0ABR8KFC3_9NOSO|nr:hypothetical protein [Nostoc paludosum FACHB-159]
MGHGAWVMGHGKTRETRRITLYSAWAKRPATANSNFNALCPMPHALCPNRILNLT